MSRLQAAPDKLFVRPTKPEPISKGGLALPESFIQTRHYGPVVSAGVETHYVPGQTVLWSNFAGIEVDFEGDELVVLRDKDVLGTIEEED